MIFVLVKAGVVEHCIAVDSADDLVEFYPEHQIIERTGCETLGWLYVDGVFVEPQ